MSTAESATTFLFVPADRPDRFQKARDTGADVVVVDLEDAVAADSKQAGRNAIAGLGPDLPARVAIRINALETEEALRDIDLLSSLRGLAAVIVPKAEDPVSLTRLHDTLDGVPVVALVETAAGVAAARDIALARGVIRIAFGHLDYAFDLGIAPVGAMFTHARCEIVIASRAAGLAPPVDGVTTELDDLTITAAESRVSRALGFGGKLCIHPKQVGAAMQAFAPGDAEIAWAKGILVAVGGAASRRGTQMVDAPLVKRARAVLQAAGVA